MDALEVSLEVSKELCQLFLKKWDFATFDWSVATGYSNHADPK